MSYDNDELLPIAHPGILLKEDFLEEMGITPYRLSKATGLSQIHVSELLKGRRNITPKTAFLLGKFFETTPEYWINLQTNYDMANQRQRLGTRLDQVESYKSVVSL